MSWLASLGAALVVLQAGQLPVLEFPEAGLDDPAAYEGYSTRFFRDSERNAFQIYLDARTGRVVHVWADAANESAAFTVRDSVGRPATVTWGSARAFAFADGDRRSVRHTLRVDGDAVDIGWFVLGTMRQERDFQYWRWHERPFGDERFVLEELSNLVRSVERLPPAERERHLAQLGARDLGELRSRLHPSITVDEDETAWVVTIQHTSLDGQHHLAIELYGDREASTARVANDVVSLRARSGSGVRFDVVVTTDAAALTPLDHDVIFNDAFGEFYARERRTSDSVSFRRLDRAVRGLELLSSQQKLMAALPNYATYFGRDMMMAALMLEPIVSVDVQEHVIANVLRKVTPAGEVSHEEALGGQAIRENAARYSALIQAWDQTRRTDSAEARARLTEAYGLLGNLQAVRENYHMIDDDFQLSVLADRYLSRADVPAARKRRFLSERNANGLTRSEALVRNLVLVAERSRPYAMSPTATNLVGFQYRDDAGFLPGSWRDSRAGYGNGRFAMDVNVVWVPKALEATGPILHMLETIGVPVLDLVSPMEMDESALATFLHDPAALPATIATWQDARRHFIVRMDTDAIREHVDAALATLPSEERAYWQRRVSEDPDALRPLEYLALALDSLGNPIAAAHTDPATDLFLEDYTEKILRGTTDPDAVVRMLDVFTRPYPVGLFVEGLGPLVVNDAYADSSVRRRFREDLYHSPRVVWGREVNLLFLGLARQIEAAYDASGALRADHDAFRSYVDALRRTLERTRHAVETSGMRHNELWSYRIEGGRLRPVRYGTSSDIQLWNLTDLAVRYTLDRLPLDGR